ncbi:PKD domain-containing protein [Limibacter armeniacum]|uniref:PKD domain-containing protein n=1 Tax=Limibacter armeniacum TaxID=466084 RepID=UPI002FE620D4
MRKIYAICCLLILFFQTGPTNVFAQQIVATVNGTEYTSGIETVSECEGASVSLSIKPNANIASYSWDFGNGNTSSLATPFDQYNNAGTYDVSVVVTFNDGTPPKTISAPGFIQVNETPKANIIVSQAGGCEGNTITISNDAPAGDYTEVYYLIDNQLYTWDGSQADYGVDVTFPDAGVYDVTIQGISPTGCNFISEETGIITIDEPFTIDFSPTDIISCNDTETVTFTANPNPIPTNATYVWDFGDGTIDSGSNSTVNHTFDKINGNSFTVSLTVTSEGGCEQTFTANSVVELLDFTNTFTFDDPSGPFCTQYGAVTFSPNLPSSLDGTALEWEFEDGTILNSTAPNSVSHIFYNNTNANKTENVILRINGISGCSETRTITIPPVTTATASTPFTQFCSEPYSATFNIDTSENLNNFYWRVNGSSQGTNNSNPTFTGMTGTTTVELVADNADGECVLYQETLVYTPITLNIIGSRGGCDAFSETYSVVVNNMPAGASIASYDWEIKDVTPAFAGRTPLTDISGNNPTINAFGLPWGDYEASIMVEVLHPNGTTVCTAMQTANIAVRLLPELDFTYDPVSPICNETTVDFTNESYFSDPNYPAVYRDEVIYEWDYRGNNGWQAGDANGDGSHFYDDISPATPGNWDVTLDVRLRARYPSTNCSTPIAEYETKEIDITAPRANFTYNLDNCEPTHLTVTNTSDGAGTMSYTWEITVNGTTTTIGPLATTDFPVSDPSFPTFTDLAVGDFPAGANVAINLIVGNGICEDDYQEYFNMPDALPEPTVTFPSQVCASSTPVSISVNEWGAAQYHWVLKDKDSGLEVFNQYDDQAIELIFTQPSKTYEGELTITLANGCVIDTTFGDISVEGAYVEIVGDATGCINTPITFTTQNADFSNDNIEWEWRVDGGTVDTGSSSTGTVDNFTHTFTNPKSPQTDNHTVELVITVDGKCPTVFSHEINVTKPTFTLDDSMLSFAYGCSDVYTDFSTSFDTNQILNAGSDATYEWFTVDGIGAETTLTPDGGSIQSPRFSLASGNYQIRLKITDANGCSDYADLNIVVPKQTLPTPDFTPTPAELSCPGIITFIDKYNDTAGNTTTRKLDDGTITVINPVLWIWDFGDGSSATTATGQVSHYYAEPTNSAGGEAYEATVTIKEVLPDGTECYTTSAIVPITVGGTKGTYELSRRIGYEGVQVDATAIPEGNDASVDISKTLYTWASGDGESGQEDPSNPPFHLKDQTFTYTTIKSGPGHTPSLTFIDEKGCKFPADYSGDVSVLECPDFDLEDQLICSSANNLVLDMSDPKFSSFTPGVERLVYSVNDAYGQANYYATLRYEWNINGTTVSDTESITFIPGSNSNLYEIDPDSNGKTIKAKVWVEARYDDLLDNSKDLTETTCIKEVEFQAAFAPTPVQDPSASSPFNYTQTCEGGTTNLSHNINFSPYAGTGVSIDYEWDLDNNGSYETSGASVTGHDFGSAGIYTVGLRVRATKTINLPSGGTKQLTCTSTFDDNVVIDAKPEAIYYFIPVCGNTYEVTFRDASTITPITDDKIVQWDWDFDNNGSIDKTFTEATYTASFIEDMSAYGSEVIFSPKLTVTTNKGCTYTTTVSLPDFTTDSGDDDVPVFKFNSPVANFKAERTSDNLLDQVCLGEEFSFTDLSSVDNSNIAPYIPGTLATGTNEITIWEWDFGDGNSSTDQNPTHTYTTTGTKTVTLTVHTERGCIKSISNDIYVRPIPEVELGDDQVVCSDGTAVLQPAAAEQSGFKYTWTQSALVGGTITVNPSSLDKHTLNIDDLTFDNGSSQIDVDYNLAVIDENFLSACEESDDIHLTILRKPIITGFSDGQVISITDCSDEHSLTPFGTETINGFTYLWEQVNVDGGSMEAIANTGLQNQTMKVNGFSEGSAKVEVTYRLTVTNSSSCSDIKEVKLIFFRTPTVAKDAFNPCREEGTTLTLKPLKNEDVPDFTYTWSNPTISGGTVNDNSDYSSQNLALEDINFDPNSILIEGSYQLDIENSLNTTCKLDPSATIDFTIKRTPEFDWVTTNGNACVESSETILLNPFKDETLAYNYNWSISNITGTDGNSIPSSVQTQFDGLKDKQVMSISIQESDFAEGQSVIQIDLALEADNDGSCSESDNQTIYFFRKPSFSGNDYNNSADCTYSVELASITENIPGFEYEWTLDTSKTTGGTPSISDSSIPNPIVSADSFTAGSSKLTAVYQLKVTNTGSPTCSRTEEYTIVFDRTPELDLSQTTTCGNSIVVAATSDGFDEVDVEWELVSGSENGGKVTPASASGSKTVTVSLDDTHEMGGYNFGSHKITADYKIKVINANNSHCDDEESFGLTFYRTPDIDFEQTMVACDLTNTLKPFGDETIAGFNYQWKNISVTGGTIENHSTTELESQDLTFKAVNFDSLQTSMTVTGTLEVFNSESSCSDVKDFSFTFYRNPIANIEVNLEECGYDAELFPLGKALILPYANGFSYKWKINTVEGASASLTDFQNRFNTLDSATMAYPTLSIDDSDFANGSHEISMNITVEVENTNSPSCESFDTIDLVFKRQPKLSFTADNADPCVVTNQTIKVNPFGTEIIAGFNYSWSVDPSAVTGYKGTFAFDSSQENDSTVSISINLIDFEDNASVITIPVHLQVTNGADTDCITEGTHEISFFRTPKIDVYENRPEECTEVTQIAVDEKVDGLYYKWEMVGTPTNNATISPLTKEGLGSIADINTLDIQVDSYGLNESYTSVSYKLTVYNTLNNTCEVTDNITLEFYRTPELNVTKTNSVCDQEAEISSGNESLNGVDFTWISSVNGGLIKTEEVESGAKLNVEVDAVTNASHINGYESDQAAITSSIEVLVANNTSNLCDDKDTVDVIFYRNPNATFTDNAPEAVCEDQSITLQTEEGFVPDFLYTWTQVGGIKIDTAQLNNQLTVSNPVFPNGIGTLTEQFTLTLTNNYDATSTACFDEKTATFTFLRIPDATIVADFDKVCDTESITLTTDEEFVDDFIYTWSQTSIKTDQDANGVGASVTTSINENEITLSAPVFPEGAASVEITYELNAKHQDNNGCSDTKSYTVTFYRIPEVVFTAPTPVCADQDAAEVLFRLNPTEEEVDNFNNTWTQVSIVTDNGKDSEASVQMSANDQYQLNLSVPHFPEGTAQITATYQLAVENDLFGCTIPSETITVVFNRNPLIDLGSDPDPVCAEQNEMLSLFNLSPSISEIGNFDYTWSQLSLTSNTGSTGASISDDGKDGWAINLTNPVFPADAAVLNAQYELSASNTLGSCEDDKDTVAVTIFRKPVVDLGDDQMFCSIQNGQGDFLTIAPVENEVTGFAYEWTQVSITDQATVTTSDLNARELNLQEVNFPEGVSEIEIEYSLKVTNTLVGADCGDILDNITVKIQRIPTVTFTAYAPVCAEDLEGNTLFTLSPQEEKVDGFTYLWERVDNGPAVTISDNTEWELNLSEPDFPDGVTTFTATYQLTVTNVSNSTCEADPVQVEVTFQRTPKVKLGDDLTACIVPLQSETIFTLSPEEELAGGFQYSWSQVSISTDTGVDGAAVTMSNTSERTLELSNAVFPEGTASITATYKLVVTNTDLGCQAEDSVTVTLFRTPYVDLGNDPTPVCAGTSVVLSAPEEVVEGYTYEWVRVSSLTDEGIEVIPNESGINEHTLTVSTRPDFPLTSVRLEAQYKLLVTNDAGGCTMESNTVTVVFNRRAITELEETPSIVCESETVELQLADPRKADFNFEWTNNSIATDNDANNATVETGISDQNLQVFNPDFPEGSAKITASYHVNATNLSPDAPEGCPIEADYTVEFARTPSFSLGDDRKVCGIFPYTVNPIDEEEVNGFEYRWEVLSGAGNVFVSNTDGYQISIDSIAIPDGETSLQVTLSLNVSNKFLPSCSSTETVNLYFYDTPTLTFSNICEVSDATFSLSGDIAQSNWLFDYDGGNLPSKWDQSVNGNTTSAFYPTAGEYNVLVEYTLESGCIDTLTKYITVYELPTTSITDENGQSGVTVLCADDNQVELTASGGEIFLWGNGESTPAITVAPEADSVFHVTVGKIREDGLVCYQEDSILVKVIPDLPISSVEQTCENQTLILDGNITEYDGLSQSFIWSDEFGNQLTTEAVIHITDPGKYTLTSNVRHESGKTCTFVKDFEAVFNPVPERVLKDTIFCFEFGDRLTLQADQGDNYVYLWDTGESTSSISVDGPGVYSVIVTDMTNETNCFTIDEVEIIAVCPPRLYVPNAFTPNADRLNDEFTLKTAHTNNIEFTVYNRWGEIIFRKFYQKASEAKMEGNGWDGTYRGKPMPAGAYNFSVTYFSDLFPEKGKFTHYGAITLIR